jgi:hypothetical protein
MRTVATLPKINSAHEITAAGGELAGRGRLVMQRGAMKLGDGRKKRGTGNKKELANYNGCFLGRLPAGSSQPTEFKLSLYIQTCCTYLMYWDWLPSQRDLYSAFTVSRNMGNVIATECCYLWLHTYNLS